VINISRSPLRIGFSEEAPTTRRIFMTTQAPCLAPRSISTFIRSRLADFAEHRYRITYRIVEGVDRVEDIKHNVIRATLLDMRYDKPLNVAIISDLPGHSGLGSSSSLSDLSP
jgi:D-glycero-alpha-D-manno-heptose-7-phosphate kinase